MSSGVKVHETEHGGAALVIDPSRSNRFVIERTLTHAGFSVTSAATGLDGLAAASEMPPDVAVIHSSLPLMRGSEVCRQLLADSQTQHAHVIMIAASEDTADMDLAINAGAKHCLTHPFDVQELQACALNALTA
jgi:CheY-like chemotaxis protein